MVNTNNCPEGFDPVINYTWPGNVEGCFCDVGINNYNVEYILEVIICEIEGIMQQLTHSLWMPTSKLTESSRVEDVERWKTTVL